MSKLNEKSSIRKSWMLAGVIWLFTAILITGVLIMLSLIFSSPKETVEAPGVGSDSQQIASADGDNDSSIELSTNESVPHV